MEGVAEGGRQPRSRMSGRNALPLRRRYGHLLLFRLVQGVLWPAGPP